MDVGDVNEPQRRYTVRRIFLPTRGIESFTVIGPDLRPVEIVDEYLAWLTDCERSPNTVEAYANDLRAFWTFLHEHGLAWEQVGVMELAEFAAWARRPAKNVVVLADEAARLSPRTVNRMLTGVVGFYELQARRGHTLAKDLIVRTRSGRGGYKPFLHGIARSSPRGRAVRLPETTALPKTLTLEQVAAVIDAQTRLRDRFLFALLASTGMRIGQALGLRHEDVVAWERRIVIAARRGASRRARSKGGAEGGVPVAAELMRLWNDYMHEEYRDLDCDHVFVNLWGGQIGRPLTYSNVDRIVERTQRRVGFGFTAHQFRHTYATLAYREGVALEVIGALLTHRSPTSTLVYTHPTAADLRKALAERGVLDKVADLV
jgi:site-specific recombinase XerD